MVKVLFVCTGNICRSPTAEGVFRHRVREAGLEDRIGTDSAGTGDYHIGDPPDPRSVRAARQVTVRDFTEFDYILAMDEGHLAKLRRMAPPGGTAEIRLFMDFTPDPPRRDVPDPYYGEGQHFTEVLDLVETGSDALLDHIRRERL